MKKYGFVYIWYDKLRKRYYIGSHWGHVDDGYICSSKWMRDAYRRRKNDFKRRIIARVHSSRAELLIEEHKWLQLIPEHKLGKDYYNLTNHLNGHWSTDKHKYKSVRQRNSETMKAKHQDPEYREKFNKGRVKAANTLKQTLEENPEIKQDHARKMRAKMAEKFPVENRPYPFAKRDPNTGEFTKAYKLRYKQGMEKYYSNRPIEDTTRRSDQAKQRKGFYKSNARKGTTNSEQHNMKIAAANGNSVIIDGIEYVSKCAAGRALGVSDGTVNNRIKSDKWPTWKLNYK